MRMTKRDHAGIEPGSPLLQ